MYACRGIQLSLLQYDAHRARLLASDGNQLDCMFVDRRGSPDVTARGNRLVICCEGNAAYYELGLLEVPAKGETVGNFSGSNVCIDHSRNCS